MTIYLFNLVYLVEPQITLFPQSFRICPHPTSQDLISDQVKLPKKTHYDLDMA